MEKQPKIPLNVLVWFVLLSPIWLPLLVLLILLYAVYFEIRQRPIKHALSINSSKFHNWKDVKLMTGASSSNVVDVLTHFTNRGVLMARLRDKQTVERIVRHYKKPIPKISFMSERNVIFYEFRYVRQGGRRFRKLRSYVNLQPINA